MLKFSKMQIHNPGCDCLGKSEKMSCVRRISDKKKRQEKQALVHRLHKLSILRIHGKALTLNSPNKVTIFTQRTRHITILCHLQPQARFLQNQVARNQSKYLSKSLTSSSLEVLLRKSRRRQFCLFLGVFSAQAGCFQH